MWKAVYKKEKDATEVGQRRWFSEEEAERFIESKRPGVFFRKEDNGTVSVLEEFKGNQYVWATLFEEETRFYCDD